MFTTDQYGSFVAIYRFNGDIAVPSGMILSIDFMEDFMPGIVPDNKFKIWRDLNGDGILQAYELSDIAQEYHRAWGWDVDVNGDIWQAIEGPEGIRVFPVQGSRYCW
jgi:hypothetical protein